MLLACALTTAYLPTHSIDRFDEERLNERTFFFFFGSYLFHYFPHTTQLPTLLGASTHNQTTFGERTARHTKPLRYPYLAYVHGESETTRRP